MLKEVSIEIIRKCPNCCLHCSSFSHSKCKEILPYLKFEELVNDAAKLGAQTICLSGGEPFLHPDIVKIVHYVHECGLKCYIYTSGIVFDEDDMPCPIPLDVFSTISKDVTKIIFNIEAGTEMTYDRIMGTHGCFYKMQESVRRAVQAGLCAEGHFVPMAINIGEIENVVSLCKRLHISKLSFLRLVLHGRAEQNRSSLELTPEDERNLRTHLYSLKSHRNLPIRIGVPLSGDSSCYKCEAAQGKLNIKFDGTVFPCEVFKNHSFKKALGNVKPDNIYEKSLYEIYTSSEYLEAIRKLSATFTTHQNCETCVGQYLISFENKEES